MKHLIWRGTSRSRIKEFPSVAQDIAGHELMKVQLGRLPSDWRTMPTIATGVIEIRVHQPHEHRVLYIASFREAIYVLHCFEKKTRRTPIKELEIARREYAELEKFRQSQNR